VLARWFGGAAALPGSFGWVLSRVRMRKSLPRIVSIKANHNRDFIFLFLKMPRQLERMNEILCLNGEFHFTVY
jgi:hypothetical protein